MWRDLGAALIGIFVVYLIARASLIGIVVACAIVRGLRYRIGKWGDP